jgi:hypothetical protein
MDTSLNETEELQQQFLEAAKQSRKHYQKTGLHITQTEFSQWVDAVQTDTNAVPPSCHT